MESVLQLPAANKNNIPVSFSVFTDQMEVLPAQQETVLKHWLISMKNVKKDCIHLKYKTFTSVQHE